MFRFLAESFFESFSPESAFPDSISESANGEKDTSPRDKGPARGPLPASSIPKIVCFGSIFPTNWVNKYYAVANSGVFSVAFDASASFFRSA